MKKRLPLDVIKGFKPQFGDTIEFERTLAENRICIFRDKDANSDFFFDIKQFDEKTKLFLVEYKPANKGTVTPTSHWFPIDQLNHQFAVWVSIIEEYNLTTTIFDDPLLKSFQEEFWNEVKLIDEDSDTKPFSTEIVLRIDGHLEHIENTIDTFKTDANQTEIDEIKALSQDLRERITKKTRNQVLRSLVNIWAKICKQGPKLIKEFLAEGGRQVVKESIKYIVGRGIELMG